MSDPNLDDLVPKKSDSPRQRAKRSLPDLASLFDEVDQQASVKKPALSVSPVPDKAESSSEAISPEQKFDNLPVEAVKAASGEESTRENTELHLHLDPELQGYLPPDLWRKLNSSEPRRGVLINSLDRLRSVLYLLSTFLPGTLVQEKMRRPVSGLVNGQILTGSLLFSDVSGFTALSERLAVLGLEGAERLTEIMNRYFAAMLDILAWSGGILVKFAGDATLVYFPEQQEGCQAGWAVRAGQRMLAAMADFSDIDTPLDKVSLKMKIGIGSGEFLAASIGDASRMEYAVLGPAANRTMAAEGATTRPGQIVVDEVTARQLEPTFNLSVQKTGFYNVSLPRLDTLDAFEIKAEQRRARGAMPWSASPQAICAQMDVALRQIQAIQPYLSAQLVERLLAQAQRRRLESEFRPVVTMFCNFTGAEALLGLWGNQGVARLTSILSAYFNAIQGVVDRYGGVITRIDPYSKGSKVLIVFGALVSHEDDPQRALNAALTMNVELEQLNERLRLKYARYLPSEFTGPLLEHRMGITYGTVFAGQAGASTRREFTVMGDDVNLAARLMGAARPGQILVNQAVREAIGDYFLNTSLEPIRVKGKSKPITIAQVDGPADFKLQRRQEKRGLLIGRQPELRRLESLFAKTLQSKLTLVTLQGPAGIGKSHLADEFLKRTLTQHPQVQVLTTQCRSYTSGNAYSTWANLLRGLAGITSIDVPPLPLEKLVRLTNEIGLPKENLSLLAPLMNIRTRQEINEDSREIVSPGRSEQAQTLLGDLKRARAIRKASAQDLLEQLDRPEMNESGQLRQVVNSPLTGDLRQRTYAAISLLFEKLAAQFPLAIFIEDAQWIDQASRDLLLYLVESLAGAPLFILLARRDEDVELSRTGAVLKLDPLTVQETTGLVAHILISDLAALIHTQSDGNPLFVEEISRWIQRTRKVSSQDVRAILQSSDILQKLVLSSLENLPEVSQEVIRAAAVIGREFRIGEVQALLGEEIDPISLSKAIRYLISARFIAQVESGVDALYVFQQALVRDVIYSSLSFERRRILHGAIADYLCAPRQPRSKLHAQIAAFLNSQPADNTLSALEEIASHYEGAEDFSSAGQFYIRAAETARSQEDPGKAGELYQVALANLERLPASIINEVSRLKAQALVGAGDMAVKNGRLLSAIPFYENARMNQSEHLEPLEKAWLNFRLALLLPLQGRVEEAQTLLGSLQPVIAGEPRLDTAIAWLSWRNGSSYQTASQGISTETSATPVTPGASLLKALVADFHGQWQQAIVAYEESQMNEAAALASVRLGDSFLQQGKLDEAGEAYQQALAIWSGLRANASGMALVAYRQAEWFFKKQNQVESRLLLNQSMVWLAQSPASIRSEGRNLVKQAFKIIEKNKSVPWPAWRWFAIDDTQRIQILFPTDAIVHNV